MTEEEWSNLTDTENDPVLTINKSKIYRGGNVECFQVAEQFPDLDLIGTTGRNDYNSDGFANPWPAGLEVKVYDNKSVSFAVTGPIDLGSGAKCYKVGAVIVKGSDASNIYTYPDGASHDIGLTPPENASGSPAGLSNLTFCFIECKEDLIIAVKVWYKEGNNLLWGVSTGTNIFTGGTWCAEGALGINSYPGTTYISIEKARTDLVIGGVNVNNGIVTITLNEGLVLDEAYIFIGTLEQLTDPENMLSGCPDYYNTPWIKYVPPSE